MKRFPSGSEWRKWDLHLHLPGTKLNNQYKKSGSTQNWKKFCQILRESDVDAFGITDYFSLRDFFEFKSQYDTLYPGQEEKIFFPNLELRLPEALNKDGQCVNIHLIFRPDLSKQDAEKFMANLDTEINGKNQNSLSCADLQDGHFESATVTRENIEKAIRDTFGKKCVPTDHVLVVTSANGDGIRPGGKGSKKRKYNLVDEIDKLSNGFFGNPSNRGHFLDTDRLETDEDRVLPKPVFAGSDAHSFDDLANWLGKEVSDVGIEKNITWIKADLTFEGLQQTLIEPTDRVAIQRNRPDIKDGYKYISKVTFKGSADFPLEIPFNPNLNSIIGSRSSGKSSLLAFISHSVDEKETLRIQGEISELPDNLKGPAAGKTWGDVAHISCEVIWGDSNSNQGKVIYIPQNSLFKTSERPEVVTTKIKPVLFRNYVDFETKHEQLLVDVMAENDSIDTAVRAWFHSASQIDELSGDMLEIGDKKAISRSKSALKKKVETLRTKSKQSKDEIARYRKLVDDIETAESRLADIEIEKRQLSNFVEKERSGRKYRVVGTRVSADIALKPTMEQLPSNLRIIISKEIEESRTELLNMFKKALQDYRLHIDREEGKLLRLLHQLRETNSVLIDKNLANNELDQFSRELKSKEADFKKVEKLEKKRASITALQKSLVADIRNATDARNEHMQEIKRNFESERRVLDQLEFGIEVDFDPTSLANLGQEFKKNELGDYVRRGSVPIDFERAQNDPGDFLLQLKEGTQKLNLRANKEDVASSILTATPEIRFTALLDADKIGGFAASSMTPGKQALFALMLILNESNESWPLLLDQPEDDLDSRSIYEAIVPYIIKRKSERQIIMVSHNANLVIGADSEEVIVANRHGDDRRNEGNRTFDYLTGSLEHSSSDGGSKYVLGKFGIREHACEILDGGEEAFQKRRDKYKI